MGVNTGGASNRDHEVAAMPTTVAATVVVVAVGGRTWGHEG